MSDRHFYLAIAVAVLTAWMFRWEITGSPSADIPAATVHFKLDRFTGSSYFCPPTGCVKTEIKND